MLKAEAGSKISSVVNRYLSSAELEDHVLIPNLEVDSTVSDGEMNLHGQTEAFYRDSASRKFGEYGHAVVTLLLFVFGTILVLIFYIYTVARINLTTFS